MSEKDLLISRIVDREDTSEDWTRLDSLAERDRLAVAEDDVFGVLVDAMRDASILRHAVSRRVAVADRIELVPAREGFLARNPFVGPWGGWMAAAVIALIWMATDPRMKRSPSGVEQDHAVAANASDETVRELPNVMVESRAIPGTDKIELFYIRQTLERAVVTGAYTLGHDEVGQPFKAKLAGFPATGTRKY